MGCQFCEPDIVALPGSEAWVESYEWGRKLEERFPGQDAHDFATGVGEHRPAELADLVIENLTMIKQGYNDGPDWLWLVEGTSETDNGYRTYTERKVFAVNGGCDYTGWDCQSHISAVLLWTAYGS